MSSNIYKIKAAGGLQVPLLAADPVTPENGLIWYNTATNTFKRYENGSTTELGGDPSVLNDLVTLSGVAANSADLGTFTGATIPDSSTIKAALQSLETAVEGKAATSHTHVAAEVTDFDSAAKAAAVSDAAYGAGWDAVTDVAPSKNAVYDIVQTKANASHTHVASDVTDFDSAAQAATISQVITDGVTTKAPSEDAVFDALALKISSSEKGAASGVATLDSNSLIPIAQIPPAALERLVVVADQAARFALTTATVQNGDTVKQTDTGVMYFVKDDTNLANANGYSEYTAGTASAVDWSGVLNTPTTLAGYGITDGMSDLVDDLSPQLGGDLDANAKAIYDANGLKIGASSTDFYVQKYFQGLTLTASQTNAVETNLSFAHATYEGVIIEYKIKEATTNRLRVGTLMIVSDGTNTSIVDTLTESADVGVAWNVNISGATTQIRYTSTANNKSMSAIAKYIKA